MIETLALLDHGVVRAASTAARSCWIRFASETNGAKSLACAAVSMARLKSPLVAIESPHPAGRSTLFSVSTSSSAGFLHAEGFAFGDHDHRVMQEPIE